ncbi:MAG: radical SAM-associated putative lipoprotein [Tannerellaceae bacterium]|jgi:putative lipoprotein (rSAM/lipoprotein system)|nr:radical SAM-associated putative lipoprotein [Tannerellaceae bacterium]
MKKKFRPFIKVTSWILSGLLALVGLGSCNIKIIINPDDDHGDLVMYGVPWASYAIKGSVVDKATQKPVKGIEVKLHVPDSVNIPFQPGWKATTDGRGEFKLVGTPDFSFPLAVTDIDGEANGSYANDTVIVDDKNPQHIGGDGGWFQGELTATVKIELEPKDE